MLQRIGVLTSGGDAPGMNACIRAVVRRASAAGLELYGFQRGFYGLLDPAYQVMGPRSVANIIQRGGTVLKTSRCPEFLEKRYRRKAAGNLAALGIGGLVVIGGDGSFRGCEVFYREHGTAIVGVPGTIDNDVYGTDETLGFDTAVNTALDLIDKIRDTASSHDRLFIVEVMGRHAGFIALTVGVAGGAEWVLVPEQKESIERISHSLMEAKKRGKASSIIVVAEGEKEGGAYEVGRKIQKLCGMAYRVCILGHTQRGGCPSARDRMLAAKLGAGAVEALLKGQKNKMIGELAGRLALTPMKDSFSRKKALDNALYRLVSLLA